MANETFVFSASRLRFYPISLQARYESAGSWPVDGIEVDTVTYLEFNISRAPAGKVCAADAAGRPLWVDIPAQPIEECRYEQCKRIDAAADAARLAVAGDPLRAAEYQIAEAEAKGYQAAGYTGDCPPSIRSWAEAKNWTAKQAAENILAEAAAWNAALYAIRDARLKAKEAVRNASTVDAAALIAEAAIDGINAKVANLGNAAS